MTEANKPDQPATSPPRVVPAVSQEDHFHLSVAHTFMLLFAIGEAIIQAGPSLAHSFPEARWIPGALGAIGAFIGVVKHSHLSNYQSSGG